MDFIPDFYSYSACFFHFPEISLIIDLFDTKWFFPIWRKTAKIWLSADFCKSINTNSLRIIQRPYFHSGISFPPSPGSLFFSRNGLFFIPSVACFPDFGFPVFLPANFVINLTDFIHFMSEFCDEFWDWNFVPYKSYGQNISLNHQLCILHLTIIEATYCSFPKFFRILMPCRTFFSKNERQTEDSISILSCGPAKLIFSGTFFFIFISAGKNTEEKKDEYSFFPSLPPFIFRSVFNRIFSFSFISGRF